MMATLMTTPRWLPPLLLICCSLFRCGGFLAPTVSRIRRTIDKGRAPDQRIRQTHGVPSWCRGHHGTSPGWICTRGGSAYQPQGGADSGSVEDIGLTADIINGEFPLSRAAQQTGVESTGPTMNAVDMTAKSMRNNAPQDPELVEEMSMAEGEGEGTARERGKTIPTEAATEAARAAAAGAAIANTPTGGQNGSCGPVRTRGSDADGSTGERRESAHLKLRTMHLDRRKRSTRGGSDGDDEKGATAVSQGFRSRDERAFMGADGGGDSAEENSHDDSSNDPGGSLPSGTMRLLEYRSVGSGEGERYASLGDDLSKFAMFLDSFVEKGQLEAPPVPPPSPAVPTTVANATVVESDQVASAASVVDGVDIGASVSGGSENIRPENDETRSQRNSAPVASTSGAAGSEVADASEGLRSHAMKEEEKGQEAAPEAVSPPAAGSLEALEEEKTAAGVGDEAAGGRWASRITVSTVNTTDESVQDSLQGLWKEGKLLSQDRDVTDVLRGEEQSFPELLSSFTTRTKSNHWENIPKQRLLEVLEKSYNPEVRSMCSFDPEKSVDDTLSSLKDMLEWFRKEFPYYYDMCHSCGNRDDNTFVGYVYPTEDERAFRAGRTEVYHCSTCGAVSRFARYSAVSKVLETQRGRCGEYSVLMLRLLEALGYSCRWVVDWSDHVWVEALVGGRWVHVDPCEAAVDEPLLYESWGKNQTFILAFTPQEVVDVTEVYTSDFDAAKARRDIDEDDIAALIANATQTLRDP